MHYVTAGRGPAMVMLHGWPQTWYCWRKLIPAFSDKFTVIAPDIRGFGDSEKPETGYERVNLAKDIVELVRGLGFEKAVVVGQDWGGALSYIIALEYPAFVERLVILDTSFFLARRGLPFNPEVWYTEFFKIPGLPEKLLRGHLGDLVRHFLVHWSHKQHYSEADLAEYARAYSQPGALEATLRHYRGRIGEYETQYKRYEGRTMDMPALVLWGERDKPIPLWTGDGLHRYLTNMRYVLIPDAGHFIQEEAAERVAEEMRRWLGDYRSS
jgi:pimeloyl-ACP methyl ester carboxylesterase